MPEFQPSTLVANSRESMRPEETAEIQARIWPLFHVNESSLLGTSREWAALGNRKSISAFVDGETK